MNLIIPSILLSVFSLFNLLGINAGLFFNQLIFFLIGFIVYFLIKNKIKRNFFYVNNRFFYFLLIGLLIVTFIIGIEVKGSKRWLSFYLFNFQSSEFLKVFFILFLADFFSKKNLMENVLSRFLKSFSYFIIPTFIIFKQPDLGNAVVFLFIYLSMIFFSDHYKKNISYLAVLTLIFMPLLFLILKDYQKARFLSFFNPHLDTSGTAYNMIQAVITIGSGKFFGRGLGLGTQSRLYFLPENTTDFAFASLVEQFGFLGGFFVILCYSLIIFEIGKKVASYFFQKDKEGRMDFFYCLGLLSYLIFQIIVNIGMNMGLLPIAGVSLPLISYGGSSMLAMMIGLALLP